MCLLFFPCPISLVEIYRTAFDVFVWGGGVPAGVWTKFRREGRVRFGLFARFGADYALQGGACCRSTAPIADYFFYVKMDQQHREGSRSSVPLNHIWARTTQVAALPQSSGTITSSSIKAHPLPSITDVSHPAASHPAAFLRCF